MYLRRSLNFIYWKNTFKKCNKKAKNAAKSMKARHRYFSCLFLRHELFATTLLMTQQYTLEGNRKFISTAV